VTQAIERGCAQQPVRKRVTPFREVEIARDDGGGALVALGDEVVQVLVLR
jgi:hypothetical protein